MPVARPRCGYGWPGPARGSPWRPRISPHARSSPSGRWSCVRCRPSRSAVSPPPRCTRCGGSACGPSSPPARADAGRCSGTSPSSCPPPSPAAVRPSRVIRTRRRCRRPSPRGGRSPTPCSPSSRPTPAAVRMPVLVRTPASAPVRCWRHGPAPPPVMSRGRCVRCSPTTVSGRPGWSCSPAGQPRCARTPS